MGGKSSGDLFESILSRPELVGPILVLARVLMAAVFMIFGIGKILHNARMQEYMVAHNVPPSLLSLAIVVQLSGALMIMFGYQTRYAAAMLAGFCVIATCLFHTDWNAGGELAQFTKDFSIAGGFLFMIAYGPGPLSIDAWRARAKGSA